MIQPSPTLPRQWLLASSSPYRRELLERLGWPVITQAPQIDERPHPGESVRQTVRRLARHKALAVAEQHPAACIIASDQLADVAGQAVGKPGTSDANHTQLARLSGQAVRFHTGVCVWFGGVCGEALDTTCVKLRELDAEAIARYVAAEPSHDCAGGFKCEGLGITLFESIHSDDPTALIGLPLIATARLLREIGYPLP